MKRILIKLSVAFSVFILSYGAIGQPSITASDDIVTRTTTYTTSNLLPGSSVFYIFGDGHFSMQDHPIHHFRANDNFNTKLYAVDPYTVTPPAIHEDDQTVDYSQTNLPPGSLTANFGMGGKIVSVGQSWNAANGYQLVLIVSFTHPDSQNPNASPVNGKIDLFLDQYLDYSGINYTSSDWASYGGVSATGVPAIPNKVSWNYYQLAPGEVRHVYVEVKVLTAFTRRIKAIAEMEINTQGCSDENCFYSDINRMHRTDKPKDPNRMYVDQDCSKALTPHRQILDYEVHFQNEGTGFAKDAILEIDINTSFNLQDIVIKESSDSCIYDIDFNRGKLVITFPDIYLPGSRQTYPQSYYFNETTGYVSFSICTEPYLPDGVMIDGFTDIYFDNEPPVQTNMVHTLLEIPCPLGVVCGLNEEYGEGIQLNRPTAPTADIQLSPNPFQDELELSYSIHHPQGERINIQLTDLSGKRVQWLLQEQYQVFGRHRQIFSLDDLPSGVYLLVVQQGDQIKTRKLVKL